MFNPVYADQVRLLLRVLPVINEQQCFALKGNNERRFLLSIKQGTPDWQLLPVPHLEQLGYPVEAAQH